jgi:hypothetical protein
MVTKMRLFSYVIVAFFLGTCRFSAWGKLVLCTHSKKLHYRLEIRLVAQGVAKTSVTARELGYMAQPRQLLSKETGLVATRMISDRRGAYIRKLKKIAEVCI